MRSHLGYTMKLHRIAAGLSREQVAVRTGYCTSYIAAMEQGKAASINAITDVLRCYGLTLADMLEQDDAGREQAIAGCRIRDIVDDYAFAVGQAGNLGGVELV